MNNAFEKHKQNVTSRPDPIQPNPCGLVFRAVMGWVKDFSPKKVKGSVCFFCSVSQRKCWEVEEGSVHVQQTKHIFQPQWTLYFTLIFFSIGYQTKECTTNLTSRSSRQSFYFHLLFSNLKHTVNVLPRLSPWLLSLGNILCSFNLPNRTNSRFIFNMNSEPSESQTLL